MRLRLILGLLLVPALAVGASGGLWLDVPFIPQVKEGCGSAVLAMVLQYWSGKGTTVAADRMEAEKIQRRLYSKEAKGIAGRGICAIRVYWRVERLSWSY